MGSQQEAVEALVERRLVLRIDGRLPALPVAGPCLDYAGAEELGTGWAKSSVAPGGENAAGALVQPDTGSLSAITTTLSLTPRTRRFCSGGARPPCQDDVRRS